MALVLLRGDFANIRIENLGTIGAKYWPSWTARVSRPSTTLTSTCTLTGCISAFLTLVATAPPSSPALRPATSIYSTLAGATSIVDYPLVTVRSDVWTSTITEWIFEVVTLSDGPAGTREKRAADAFLPVLDITPFWPAVVYTGTNGKATTTSATVPFCRPPASVGPDAPAPPSGS